ncbi:MAG: hypothetical protein EB078_01495 [Proteobacteria bacterium]|nr:hypothetical protein [Pseudomonadota bacterium]
MKITAYWSGDTESTDPTVCSSTDPGDPDQPFCKIFRTGTTQDCKIPAGTSLNSTEAIRTCDVEIPETMLHFSKLKFEVSASAGHTCDVVYMYPYYYLASRAPEFRDTWIDDKVDCANLTSGFPDAQCYSGPATQIEGFPRFRNLAYPFKNKSVAFSKEFVAESAYDKKRFWSNEWTGYQAEPNFNYNLFSAPSFSGDIPGQPVNWRFQCANKGSNLNYEYVLHIKPKKDNPFTPGAPRYYAWNYDTNKITFTADTVAGSNILSNVVGIGSLSAGQEFSGLGFVSPRIISKNLVTNQITLDQSAISTNSGASFTTYGDSIERVSLFSVTPAEGPLEGETEITITTTSSSISSSPFVFLGDFLSNTQKLCNEVTAVNGSVVRCKTPAATDFGLTDVSLGNSSYKMRTMTGLFDYKALDITSINPGAGPASGGISLVVSGQGIANNSEVRIGVSDEANCSSPTIANGGTSVSCTTPALTAGTYDVKVNNPSSRQKDTLATAYVVFSPSIDTPGSVAQTPLNPTAPGATSLTLTGSFHTGGNPYSVTVGDLACGSVVNTGGTQLTCNLPAQTEAGTYTITVKDKYDQSATLDGFVKYFVPTISTVSPNLVTIGSLGDITITGEFNNLGSSYIVTVGGSDCTGVVQTPTQITCTLPSKTAGSHDVKVTDRFGQSATLSNGIEYQEPAAP